MTHFLSKLKCFHNFAHAKTEGCFAISNFLPQAGLRQIVRQSLIFWSKNLFTSRGTFTTDPSNWTSCNGYTSEYVWVTMLFGKRSSITLFSASALVYNRMSTLGNFHG